MYKFLITKQIRMPRLGYSSTEKSYSYTPKRESDVYIHRLEKWNFPPNVQLFQKVKISINKLTF